MNTFASSLLHVIAFSFLATCGPVASAQSLPDIIDRIRPGVVAVGVLRSGKGPGAKRPSVEYKGTGFVVADGHTVVTNVHVLPENNGDDSEKLAVFVGQGKAVSARRARVLAVDTEHDLALLKISGEKVSTLALATANTVREGDPVAITGFPIGMVLGLYPATNVGIISAKTPIVIPAPSASRLTAEMIARMKNPYEVYQLDITAFPGNSGSPVYSVDTGQVIAVVNSVLVKSTKESALTDPSGITYAIPVSYVEALLAKAP
ncbi:MAG: serine protease [Porticoccaceae bacterium]|nr:serine protease [Porticoccaceae bacterium]